MDSTRFAYIEPYKAGELKAFLVRLGIEGLHLEQGFARDPFDVLRGEVQACGGAQS